MPVLQHMPEPEWNVLAPSSVTGCQLGRLWAPSTPELWGWEGHSGAGMWPPQCSAPALCTGGTGGGWTGPSEHGGLSQGAVGGDSTHQSAQELSDSRGPDREMKGPEQRSLPWSEERAFSPSARSALGRNWLNQDDPTLQCCSCCFPAFDSWRVAAALAVAPFCCQNCTRKVQRKGQGLLENLPSFRDWC